MRSSLILITLAAGAAAQTTPLTCPTAEIPPASVHKSTVAARFRSGRGVAVSARVSTRQRWRLKYDEICTTQSTTRSQGVVGPKSSGIRCVLRVA
jgi:hypothetical protein